MGDEESKESDHQGESGAIVQVELRIRVSQSNFESVKGKVGPSQLVEGVMITGQARLRDADTSVEVSCGVVNLNDGDRVAEVEKGTYKNQKDQSHPFERGD